MNKETFKKKSTNENAITAGSVIAIQYIEEADKDNNLPHNQVSMTNRSTEELFIYLDDMLDADVPDYVLKTGQQMNISHEEGVTFSTIFVKNVDSTNQVEAKELKWRVSTVKEV